MKSIALVFAFVLLINFLLTDSFEIKRSLDSNNENNDNSLIPVILNDDEDMSAIKKRSKGKQTDSNSKGNSKSKKDKKKKRKHLRRRKESYEDRMLRVLAKTINNLTKSMTSLILEVKLRLDAVQTVPPSKTTNSTTLTTKPTSEKSLNFSKKSNKTKQLSK
uniref:Uncharacterized protein n=1 Tax=Strongyloides papillosus TaxID=174720 RepID=A0A0N5BCE8_STREA